MSSDIVTRAKKLERRNRIKKLKKVLPLIALILILLLTFLPAKSKIVYATVETSPSLLSTDRKHTQFTAKLSNKDIVTVKSKELLNLSVGDRIKLNRTTSILFSIKRYSFYSKIYP